MNHNKNEYHQTPPVYININVTHSGPEVSFKTCVAMKFVDDDYDDD